MARPKKAGLGYFPKDVDTWDDFKIMDLVNEYGPLGYCIYDIVRDEVYRNGYYLEVSLDNLARLIVRKIGNRWIKEKGLVRQVIQYCADIGLFDNALLTQSVITSVGIQRRYSEVTVRNKVNTDKYWLLEKNEPQTALESAVKTSISVTKNPVSATKTPVSATFIPQKESKVNKSKLKCVLEIPCKNGSFTVDEDYYKELTHTYQNMDVIESLKALRAYMLSNPEKQRNKNAVVGCIEWWLSGDEEKQRYRKKSKPSYDLEVYKLNNTILEEEFS